MLRSAVLIVMGCLASSTSSAQDLEGLFAREGVEVRADQRVFTLFALFNALGYDREPLRGAKPLDVPQFAVVRSDVRLALQTKPVDLAAARSFVDKHTQPIEWYLERTLRLGPAPDFAPPKGNKDAELTQLADLLKAFSAARGNELFQSQREALRDAAKAWVQAIDKATDANRALVRLTPEMELENDDDPGDGAAARLVVVVNPLDAHGAAYEIPGAEVHHLVVGPPQKSLDEAVDPIVVSAMTNVLRPEVARALKKLDGAAVKKVLGGKAGRESTAQTVSRLLAYSFATRAAGRPLQWPAGVTGGEGGALGKLADGAVAWYADQKAPLPKLADQVVARALGLKGGDSKRGS